MKTPHRAVIILHVILLSVSSLHLSYNSSSLHQLSYDPSSFHPNKPLDVSLVEPVTVLPNHKPNAETSVSIKRYEINRKIFKYNDQKTNLSNDESTISLMKEATSQTNLPFTNSSSDFGSFENFYNNDPNAITYQNQLHLNHEVDYPEKLLPTINKFFITVPTLPPVSKFSNLGPTKTVSLYLENVTYDNTNFITEFQDDLYNSETSENLRLQSPLNSEIIARFFNFLNLRNVSFERFINETTRNDYLRFYGVLKQDPFLREKFLEFASFLDLPPSDFPGVVSLDGRSSRSKRDDVYLTILGLFELTSLSGQERPEGLMELKAAHLAVNHVNSLSQLLGPFKLKLITNDTKCDAGVAVDAFFHAIYTRRERMLMLLGSSCADVTETLAKVVPYWNILQVSYGCKSAGLSERKEYPLFYRTVAPDSSHNPARVALIRSLGWNVIATLSQAHDSLTINDLVTELESANITCKATLSFTGTEYSEQFSALKEQDARIIIGSFSSEVAPKIFCEAIELGMCGSEYGWVLEGRPEEAWWLESDHCGPGLAQAVESAILISSHDALVGDAPSLSGIINSEFVKLVGGSKTGFSRQSYDAIWAMALAINRSLAGYQPDSFRYASKRIAATLSNHMGQLEFSGISGPVAFSGPDRIGITAIYQIQSGQAKQVGLYDGTKGVLELPCRACHRLSWPGGQVPIAERIFKIKIVSIEPAAFLTVATLASLGIIISIAFLMFNLYFRKVRYVKLSSPKLNNIAVLGCALVYAAVILLGLDAATLPSAKAFPALCTARVCLLSAGFSLAFGSIFAKTYRVHRIFTRSASGVVKNKMLQDTQLISLICILLVVDGLIVTFWVTIDPMERHLKNLTTEMSTIDRSVLYQLQVEVCGSNFTHGWLAALYTYKGLLLIVGLYMAWETRHVKIEALNDSQYIGFIVYSVVITSVSVVVMAQIISERATLAFIAISTLILLSTTIALCFLAIPKIHAILGRERSTDNIDPIMQSMGLKIEFNTRRFMSDDKREVYYRVEVQNRVYKRELANLEGEIAKLERQINNEASHTSSRSSLNKGELDEALERLAGAARGKSPSVSGGIPMLLLSVLPPVIPRASWPSAQHAVYRPEVTFNSEPKLDNETGSFLHSSAQHNEPKVSVLGRFMNLLGTRTTDRRKSSAASYAGNPGIASALRAHVGYLANFVPSNKPTSSEPDSFESSHHALDELKTRSTQTLSQPRVSFSLQNTQSSQPSLVKHKGSPRFPHRIVPTVSLSALPRRSCHLQTPDNNPKCRSLEDARPSLPGRTSEINMTPNPDIWNSKIEPSTSKTTK